MNFGIFVLGIIGTFVALGITAWIFVWPWLKKLSYAQALKILILPHAFRFIGLSFLFPGVVGAALPSGFAQPAAWGDFGAAALAIIALIALHKRWPFAVPLVWIFNIWGYNRPTARLLQWPDPT